MLYIFWVTLPPFGFDLYPLLACWEHCQMFYQPVYVVKEWEIAEAGECPFCRLQYKPCGSPEGEWPGWGQTDVDAILAADKEDERQLTMFGAA